MEWKNQLQFSGLEILYAVFFIATSVWFLHRKIKRNPSPNSVRPRKTGWKISEKLQLSEIGVNFNKWRRPVSSWGHDDEALKLQYGSMDIGQKDWDRATETVDAVLTMLLCEMRKIADREYKDLVIGKYVRQGSSREGLKVRKADEFDVLLLFYIKGIPFKINHLTDAKNFILPEFGRLVVADDNRNLWHYHEYIVFDEESGKYCLNSRKLHEKMFISIIQRAANEVRKTVYQETKDEKFYFTIEKIRKNPPSVNIQIELQQEDENFPHGKYLIRIQDRIYGDFIPESARFPVRKLIDVDIVPGIQLRTEQVPNPTDWEETMECPKYAVFKWVEQNHPAAAYYECLPDIRWRVCTSGYEKHMIDVTRGSEEQRYILSALRSMKFEFQRLRDLWRPPELVTVLRSYYLKHIAFYCILYLTVINKVGLSGVKEALAYYLDFLQVVLEEKRLPHFFHDNEFIVYMFPSYEMNCNTLRYDLFTCKSKDSLERANLSFKSLKLKQQLCQGASTFSEYAGTFRKYIQAGKYYTGPNKA